MIALVVMCVLLVSGCSYEKRVDRSQPGPPLWVQQMPADTEETKVFVGMALADNILDERSARRRAMADVREQIALSLMTDVQSRSAEIIEEEGAQHLGEDEDDASYYAELQNKAEQALAGVRQEAYYWEKWRVKRGIFSPSFTRYKYYMRASIPREHYQEVYRSVAQDIRENRE
jgi:hypothetical protein